MIDFKDGVLLAVLVAVFFLGIVCHKRGGVWLLGLLFLIIAGGHYLRDLPSYMADCQECIKHFEREKMFDYSVMLMGAALIAGALTGWLGAKLYRKARPVPTE